MNRYTALIIAAFMVATFVVVYINPLAALFNGVQKEMPVVYAIEKIVDAEAAYVAGMIMFPSDPPARVRLVRNAEENADVLGGYLVLVSTLNSLALWGIIKLFLTAFPATRVRNMLIVANAWFIGALWPFFMGGVTLFNTAYAWGFEFPSGEAVEPWFSSWPIGLAISILLCFLAARIAVSANHWYGAQSQRSKPYSLTLSFHQEESHVVE